MARRKTSCPSPPPSTVLCGWRAWLNGTTITLGMQNVFDSDPPFVGRRLREWLRRIPCRRQRPVLVRPAKEKILTELEQLHLGIPEPQEDILCAASRASKKSSPPSRRDKLSGEHRPPVCQFAASLPRTDLDVRDCASRDAFRLAAKRRLVSLRSPIRNVLTAVRKSQTFRIT